MLHHVQSPACLCIGLAETTGHEDSKLERLAMKTASYVVAREVGDKV
jgi:hypothetical protein